MSKMMPKAVVAAVSLVTLVLAAPAPASAQQYRISAGVAVYLGILPAQTLRGHTPGKFPEAAPHGRAPRGVHQYHLTAAVFDAKTGERISDARVSATIAGLGLGGSRIELKPMQIAGTVTYGGYFNLPGDDRYTIRIEIRRPNQPKAIRADFVYEHRLR